MIHTLTTINDKTKHARVNIQFDKRISMRSKCKVFENSDLADIYIDAQLQMAIRIAITKFVNQRRYILLKYPSSKDSIEQLYHADAILAEMAHHSRSPLVVLTASVHWIRARIFALAPSPNSRYRKHFDEVIEPIVDWCSAHSLKARCKLK